MKKQKMVHLITGLGKGGAETMLYQIIKNRNTDTPASAVVSLGLSHYYEEPLKNFGIRVISLDIRHHPLRTLIRLFQIGKNTEILCCWMYLSCFLGYLVGRKHAKKLIWCIRHSDLSINNNSRKTLLFCRMCARLSPKVDMIAYNGDRARKVHAGKGYRPIKEAVLDNGIDGVEYFPDEEAGERFRRKLGIRDDSRVIVSVARNTAIKDLPTFVRMLSIVREKNQDAVGVMCGYGIDCSDEKLMECCKDNNLTVGKDIFLIGFRENVREVMNAADVYVLHSAGEAFPNTLLQAMACGTLAAATDVGDVGKILGSRELIAKPGDYRRLAEIVSDLIAMDEEEKKMYRKRNREAVLSRYDIRKITESYEELFRI